MTPKRTSGKYYRFDDLSILVADDNRFVRSILVTILKALGVGKVIQADNGEEAIAVLEVSAQMQLDVKEVDVVFADHLMAPGDGLELLRWIRTHENDKVKFLPVIMMSGEADYRSVTAARDVGVTEYLAKPMSVLNVASRLLAVIDRPRPFVRAPGYFGPDRRRQTLSFEGQDRRVMPQDSVRLVDDGEHVVMEQQAGVDQGNAPSQESEA